MLGLSASTDRHIRQRVEPDTCHEAELSISPSGPKLMMQEFVAAEPARAGVAGMAIKRRQNIPLVGCILDLLMGDEHQKASWKEGGSCCVRVSD